MNVVQSGRIWRATQTGLSLVELMIAMVLGLIIISAVLYVFAGNRASYSHQESLSHIQESGRFALELLSRDIRMAGYAGCGNLRETNPVTNISPSPPVWNNATTLTGTETQISMLTAGPAFARLSDAMPSLTQIPLGADPLVGVGARMIVTDCANVEIFDLGSLSGPTGTPAVWTLTSAQPLTRAFQSQSQVMRLRPVAYVFDDVNNRLNRNGEPIVEGVTALSFDYGIGADRNVTSYTSVPGDWARVSTVRVNMTISSLTPPVLSHEFSKIIGIRNRLP